MSDFGDWSIKFEALYISRSQAAARRRAKSRRKRPANAQARTARLEAAKARLRDLFAAHGRRNGSEGPRA